MAGNDQSPWAQAAAMLYPATGGEEAENGVGGEEYEGEEGGEGDEDGDENLPVIKNFDKVFEEIGRLKAQKDFGRAEMSEDGGLVATNLAIQPGAPGYWGSLCATRLSHAMTKFGNPLDPEAIKRSGARSSRDKSGNRYIYGVEDGGKYLDKALGNGIDVTENRDAMQGQAGYLVVEKPQVIGKKHKVQIFGHWTMWDGYKTADNSEKFMDGAKRIFLSGSKGKG